MYLPNVWKDFTELQKLTIFLLSVFLRNGTRPVRRCLSNLFLDEETQNAQTARHTSGRFDKSA